MSTKTTEIIETNNLSDAWARAFLRVTGGSKQDLAPLSISIGCPDPGLPIEDTEIRRSLDHALADLSRPNRPLFGCRTSSNTIFPFQYWEQKGRPDCVTLARLYMSEYMPRYHGLRHAAGRNKTETYFQRMISFTGLSRGGEVGVTNQLAHIIELWRRGKLKRRRPRQSALQIACFDPAKDHTGAVLSGFPCLQQVSLSYDDNGRLAMNAFYPTQYIFDRAYGNYLGLCHLGFFMAHEMGLKFRRLNCFVGHPELGDVRKQDLRMLAHSLSTKMADVQSAARGADE